VRCLSPEVIASVKKTVSFSDEVLEKPTRLVVQGKTQDKNSEEPDVRKPDGPKPDGPKTDGPKPDGPKPDGPKPDGPKPDVPKPDVPKPDVSKPDLLKTEVLKAEINSAEANSTADEQKSSARNVLSKDNSLSNSAGVIIKNGLEVREPVMEEREVPLKESTTKIVPVKESNSNIIAQIKEVSRCSCHVEGCHCRDITRPTRAVISQAKAAKERARDAMPQLKLLVSYFKIPFLKSHGPCWGGAPQI
jgi:hypothetical protein